MLAELALTAARRSEQALGPGSAVLVIGAALDTTQGEPRRTLLLAGMGAAIRASDARAFATFRGAWATSGGGADETRGLSLVARLDANGLAAEALDLARAERERFDGAHAAHALAALVERHGRSEEAAALFSRAAKLAAGTPLAARAARAALRHAPPERADEAEAALTASSDPREALRLADAALGAAGLYTRVRVLDRLAELASDARWAESTLRIAARYADLRGAALGALERDRLLSIATRAGAPAGIREALAGRGASKVDEAAARDALMGHAPRTEPADRGTAMALRALAACVREDGSASLLLSALTAHAPSPAGWTAALVGLSHAPSRAAAITCAERWLALDVAPPLGFAALAEALARAEAPALAERAWQQAIRANERGARARLGALLAARARRAYAAGDRETAKTLLERSLAIDPEV